MDSLPAWQAAWLISPKTCRRYKLKLPLFPTSRAESNCNRVFNWFAQIILDTPLPAAWRTIAPGGASAVGRDGDTCSRRDGDWDPPGWQSPLGGWVAACTRFTLSSGDFTGTAAQRQPPLSGPAQRHQLTSSQLKRQL